MKLKIVVSHPGKQYVHQLLYILQQKGYLHLFITSIWYKPSSLFYKLLVKTPVIGEKIFHKFLKRKTYETQKDILIEQYPWRELLRQILVQFSTTFRLEKYVFKVERTHDKFVAKRLQKLKPNVFIGYEKCSLNSFKEIKRQGGTTILDLAQVHYKYLIKLSETQETFKDLYEDTSVFEAVNQIKKEEYDYADYILCLSEFAKSTLTKYGIKENKIRVVNLGFDPEIFTLKTSYTTRPGLRLIFTGTFTKRKGIHLLLEAITELDLKDLHLTIIGPLLDGQELFNQYKGAFEYYDFLHHEDLVKHLHKADIYVFPSYLDSWAMTVVEAMACGLPVIVTDHTGAKDAVTEGESGFVISSGSKEELKKSILFFYSNKDQIERMGQAAHRSSLRYNWKNYHQRILEILDNIR